ncbi:hypothetical protein GBAR_LOCUS11385 [Geodia barretti]|uniref:Uncharacterized protein n=1 Tax=Geodia barretti TaxID=519541 RepID=A0AA35RX57_GEOBA|nr:hypothetical protein GBAR_LOCUS11385 [Geodia barretti]
MERDDLRKRMTVKSVSPVGGASDRQHSLIARPPSAPYLPRTSSPGVGDTGNYMTSLLNQTDPGPLPSTRPQPIFPITGRPEPSPFFPPPDQRGHFPPSQPPLQHPIPERERPRYPLPPPPGRRLIRGYPPPFERRPPRPGVYGPGPRFYHDARDRVPGIPPFKTSMD